jgi:hypothetical protein
LFLTENAEDAEDAEESFELIAANYEKRTGITPFHDSSTSRLSFLASRHLSRLTPHDSRDLFLAEDAEKQFPIDSF